MNPRGTQLDLHGAPLPDQQGKPCCGGSEFDGRSPIRRSQIRWVVPPGDRLARRRVLTCRHRASGLIPSYRHIYTEAGITGSELGEVGRRSELELPLRTRSGMSRRRRFGHSMEPSATCLVNPCSILSMTSLRCQALCSRGSRSRSFGSYHSNRPGRNPAYR